MAKPKPKHKEIEPPSAEEKERDARLQEELDRLEVESMEDAAWKHRS
jgi:hypothetical protein